LFPKGQALCLEDEAKIVDAKLGCFAPDDTDLSSIQCYGKVSSTEILRGVPFGKYDDFDWAVMEVG